MVALADLLDRYKPPERTVTVCLRGDLRARHDELSRQLESVRMPATAKMGDSSQAVDLAAELRQLEEEMREATAAFRFKALGHYALRQLEERFPAKSGRGWDVNEGAHALLAATSVEPAMTEDEARQLLEALDRDNALRLVNTAWEACTGSADVPFFGRAFESIAGTDSK